MSEWHAEIRRRLTPFALRPTREMEIVEEIAQHLEDRYTGLRALDISEEEATRRAWRELDEGDVLGRAISRVESVAPLELPPPGSPYPGSSLSSLWQDIRYSGRTLCSAPAFSLTVLLAVALSIGPVTAILSVGNWLLWRPHPGVTDSRSVAVVWFGRWSEQGVSVSFSPSLVSYENLTDFRARARTITGMAGVQESRSSLAVAGRLPREIGTAMVTADFFDVLGVRFSAGRSFSTDEDRGPFGSPLAVIGHNLAESAFGSARGALGQSILLNSRPFPVIGVVAPEFGGVSSSGGIDVWLPGATWPYLNHVQRSPASSREDGIFYEFVVRAAPGRTFTEVESELKVLARGLADDHPAENEKFLSAAPRVFPGLGLMPLMRARTSTMVNTMLAIGGVLVLLGCANVANLLTFRAARREHEMAVRKALGASRWRLLRLQLMESWLLWLGGAALGLALAVYLKELIERLLFPLAQGFDFAVPIDARVLTLTTALALATGTLAALVPGWLVTRTRGLAALGRATVTWRRAPRMRIGLAVFQLALSLTLLIGALLLVATLRHLRAVPLGFEPDGVTVLTFSLDEHGYDTERALAYHRQVLPALQSTSAFEGASLAGRAPFGPGHSVRVMLPEGNVAKAISVRANGVSDSYFRLLSIPLVRGRAFTAAEALEDGGPGLVILNETLAHQLFGTVDVVGRAVRLERPGAPSEQELTIVGIASSSRWRGITGEAEPFLYQPFGQFRSRGTRGVYLIKSDLPPIRAGEVASSIAARAARDVPLSVLGPLTANIDRALSEPRVFAWVLSLLAVLGFALAALGLYGLVGQTMVDRRRELGIRLALGATAGNIVRLVACQAAVVSSCGVVFGLVFSYFGTRVVQSMLVGASRADPVPYLSAVAMLILAVTLASIGPVLRALRVEPVEVLRAE